MSVRQSRLIALYMAFERDVDELRDLFDTALEGKHNLDHTTPSVNRAAAWQCVINLHDAWARFSKRAVMISAKGRVLTRKGTPLRLSKNLGRQDDPEAVLKMLSRQNKIYWGSFGPKWEIPSIAIQAAQVLDIDNLIQFTFGMSTVTPAHSELKACRNYLAHRHQGTAVHHDIDSLRRRVRVPRTSVAPAALAAAYVPGRGVRVFEEWCIDLKRTAGLALD